MNKLIATAAALMLAAPAYADSHENAEMAAPSGDIAKGEKAFRKCRSCHVVKNDEGEVLAGRNARTGPNLYGLAGRTLGSVEGFRYGKPLVTLGEQGMTWDEEKFVTYVQDPTAWLREQLDDNSVRSRMSFRERKAEEAADLYAFLYSLKPPEADAAAE